MDLLYKWIQNWIRDNFIGVVSNNSDYPDGTLKPVKDFDPDKLNVDLSKPFTDIGVDNTSADASKGGKDE